MSLPFNRHPRRCARAGMLWSGWLLVGDQHRIELSLHPFFPLTLVAVTLLLGLGLLPRFFPGWPPGSYWLVAAAVAMLDGLAGLLHELGHAGVAMARGRTVSCITLYGLAAAVRRSSGATHSADQVLIALAGPLSHLLLASALWAAWTMLPSDNEPLRVAAGFPALSNFIAALFNTLPVAPLDGGRAAKALSTLFPRVRPSAVRLIGEIPL